MFLEKKKEKNSHFRLLSSTWSTVSFFPHFVDKKQMNSNACFFFYYSGILKGIPAAFFLPRSLRITTLDGVSDQSPEKLFYYSRVDDGDVFDFF